MLKTPQFVKSRYCWWSYEQPGATVAAMDATHLLQTEQDGLGQSQLVDLLTLGYRVLQNISKVTKTLQVNRSLHLAFRDYYTEERRIEYRKKECTLYGTNHVRFGVRSSFSPKANVVLQSVNSSNSIPRSCREPLETWRPSWTRWPM